MTSRPPRIDSVLSECPRCDETIRVPDRDYPDGAQARCPWCRSEFPVAEILGRVAPVVEILPVRGDAGAGRPGATGAGLEGLELIGSDSRRETGTGATSAPPLNPMKVEPNPAISLRHKKRPSSPLRTIVGVALGPLIAVPIAALILLAVNRAPDLGFYPFDGSFNRNSSGDVVPARTPASPANNHHPSYPTADPHSQVEDGANPPATSGRSLANDLEAREQSVNDAGEASRPEIDEKERSRRLNGQVDEQQDRARRGAKSAGQSGEEKLQVDSDSAVVRNGNGSHEFPSRTDQHEDAGNAPSQNKIARSRRSAVTLAPLLSASGGSGAGTLFKPDRSRLYELLSVPAILPSLDGSAVKEIPVSRSNEIAAERSADDAELPLSSVSAKRTSVDRGTPESVTASAKISEAVPRRRRQELSPPGLDVEPVHPTAVSRQELAGQDGVEKRKQIPLQKVSGRQPNGPQHDEISVKARPETQLPTAAIKHSQIDGDPPEPTPTPAKHSPNAAKKENQPRENQPERIVAASEEQATKKRDASATPLPVNEGVLSSAAQQAFRRLEQVAQVDASQKRRRNRLLGFAYQSVARVAELADNGQRSEVQAILDQLRQQQLLAEFGDAVGDWLELDVTIRRTDGIIMVGEMVSLASQPALQVDPSLTVLLEEDTADGADGDETTYVVLGQITRTGTRPKVRVLLREPL